MHVAARDVERARPGEDAEMIVHRLADQAVGPGRPADPDRARQRQRQPGRRRRPPRARRGAARGSGRRRRTAGADVAATAAARRRLSPSGAACWGRWRSSCSLSSRSA